MIAACCKKRAQIREISSDLKEKYNVNVNYFVADLKDKSAPQEIYDYVKSSNLIYQY